jgi:nucleotide-binding universal stress UspA family protein
MFSKILVGINGSEDSDKAFEHACFLSQKSRAQLLILHVLEEFPNIGYSISKALETYSKDILRKYEDKAKRLGLQSVHTIQAR